MRSRSIVTFRNTRLAPPAGLSSRYTAFGILLVMVSCTVSQPSSQFTTPFSTGAVRGFQIQVHSTQDKTVAESVVSDAEAWWQVLEEPEQRSLFGVGYLPVEIKWLDPYYRIRIGHFRSRDEARVVLDKIAAQFPAAFIVPDTIL